MDQKRYLRRVRMNQFERVCRRWKEVSVIFLASNIHICCGVVFRRTEGLEIT